MNVGVDNRAKAINQIFVGVNNIAKLVYSSSGGSGSFELPTFTGNNAVFGDELSGRIELYESGTLTLSPGTYDFFLVGGGASGQRRYNHNGYSFPGGGGAGYTTTASDISISNRTEFSVQVGAGANGITTGIAAGGQSAIRDAASTINHTANGGNAMANTDGYKVSYGGKGGSGGGAGSGYDNNGASGFNGGSDGGNGGGNNSFGSVGGAGQGTTTRMFGESGSTLYAGGGGGCGGSNNQHSGSGGAGGGGTASAGTPNTGGGGAGNFGSAGFAGGSGIVIVRWNNT